MTDLARRIEEITGVQAILLGDFELLKSRLGPLGAADEPTDEDHAHRRSFVRALFALVEATVDQHRILLLDLHDAGKVALEPKYWAVLREVSYSIGKNGEISEQVRYMSLNRKIRAVYRVAGQVFGGDFEDRFGDNGWAEFQEAIAIRHRVTHPKSVGDIRIGGPQIELLMRGETWFRRLHDEFIRVATAHRRSAAW